MEEIENVCIVRYGKLEINFFLLSRRIFCRELGRGEELLSKNLRLDRTWKKDVLKARMDGK